jgi:hypothetical protein
MPNVLFRVDERRYYDDATFDTGVSGYTNWCWCPTQQAVIQTYVSGAAGAAGALSSDLSEQATRAYLAYLNKLALI